MNQIHSFEIERRLGYIWVKFPDSISLDLIKVIENAVVKELSGSQDKLVLDLSNTSEIFSTGFGLLIRLRKVVVEGNGIICIVNLQKKIKDLLTAFNLDKIFPLYTTDVEFEISHGDLWSNRKKLNTKEMFFVARLENHAYRINVSGQMIGDQNCKPLESFQADPSVAVYIFDLSGLELIDNESIVTFKMFLERLRAQGKNQLKVYGVSEHISELFKLYDVDRLLQFYQGEKEALNEAQL